MSTDPAVELKGLRCGGIAIPCEQRSEELCSDA